MHNERSSIVFGVGRMKGGDSFSHKFYLIFFFYVKPDI